MKKKIIEPHAITQARIRYKLELSHIDLIMIIILVQYGLAKEIVHSENNNTNARYFNLRYGGKLIQPCIINLDTDSPFIVTFMPTGKHVSHKRHLEQKIDKDWKAKQRRLKLCVA